jgi:ketosteroid isomerase-like protein
MADPAYAGREMSSTEVALAVLQARDEGRIEDMLALVHRDVVWWPVSRPGRSMYEGHAGTRQMVRDLHESRGAFRTQIKEVLPQAGGRVLIRGDAILSDGCVDSSFYVLFGFRDGLVLSVEANRLGGR